MPGRSSYKITMTMSWTIVITWAKFIGKYNERLFGVSDLAKIIKI